MRSPWLSRTPELRKKKKWVPRQSYLQRETEKRCKSSEKFNLMLKSKQNYYDKKPAFYKFPSLKELHIPHFTKTNTICIILQNWTRKHTSKNSIFPKVLIEFIISLYPFKKPWIFDDSPPSSTPHWAPDVKQAHKPQKEKKKCRRRDRTLICDFPKWARMPPFLHLFLLRWFVGILILNILLRCERKWIYLRKYVSFKWFQSMVGAMLC